MKKILCVLLTAVLLSVSFMGCARIVKKPADTNLEFWITENVTEYDFSEHYFVPGWWGANAYYGKAYSPVVVTLEGRPVDPEHCVTYVVSSYPDEASRGQHITRIEITDPAVTFYGITMESSDEEIIAAMEKHGYTYLPDKYKDTPFSDRLYFEDGNISFSFHGDQIIINAGSTNKQGIMYLYRGF